MTELFILTIIAFFFAFWLNQAQARDLVRATGKYITKNKHLIFLDDSVMMKKIRIRPILGKLAFHRIYHFEFSHADSGRCQGVIKHHGGKVTEIQYFHEDHIETVSL